MGLELDLTVKTHDLVANQQQTGCLLKNTQKHSGILCAFYARIAQARTDENRPDLLKRSIQYDSGGPLVAYVPEGRRTCFFHGARVVHGLSPK